MLSRNDGVLEGESIFLLIENFLWNGIIPDEHKISTESFVAITDWPILKTVSAADIRCALVQAMIVTDHIWKKEKRR